VTPAGAPGPAAEQLPPLSPGHAVGGPTGHAPHADWPRWPGPLSIRSEYVTDWAVCNGGG